MIAGEKADQVRRPGTSGLPRQLQGGRRQLAGTGLVMKRRKRLPALHLPGSYQLWHGKYANLPRVFRGVNVSDGRIRRP